MESSLSPVLACMVMEIIEQNAIETFSKPPSIWVRYVDDVYSIVETNQIALFHDHLNTIFSSIKFTKELESEGTLSFLDVAVIRKTDGTLSTDIYRKPTHTGRYLSFTSHHPLNQKLSIARTLYSRANNIISDENKKIQEFHHVSDILKSNGFPSHKRGFSFKTNLVASQQSNQQFQGFATIPYVQGISEPIKRILAEVGIRVAMTSFHTIFNFSEAKRSDWF